MERSRQVPLEESETYAASIGASLFGTSAKLNRGVEQAFLAIARSASGARARAMWPLLVLASAPASHPSPHPVPCAYAELIEQNKGAQQPAGAAYGAASYRPRAGIVVLQQGSDADAKQKPLAASACC
jgi:hypothetical protein